MAQERPPAPLRILVTRRTKRDRIISVQYVLSEMGYLEPQKFSGRLGKGTITAIKAFQKGNGLRETGVVDNELAKEIYRVAGKAEPPEGHLFVRQDFRPLFDVPIAFRNPEQTLGTHVLIALNFAPGDTTTQWMAISLEGDDAAGVLDRIRIPDDIRQKISERLNPGSSLIIGERARKATTLWLGASKILSISPSIELHESSIGESGDGDPAVSARSCPHPPSPRPDRAARLPRGVSMNLEFAIKPIDALWHKLRRRASPELGLAHPARSLPFSAYPQAHLSEPACADLTSTFLRTPA